MVPGCARGSDLSALAARIDAALPQTQCTRCGYPDCHSYAQAVAQGTAAIDRCPPGGAEGVARLAAIAALAVAACEVDPQYGQELPRGVAVIDEDWCIGCTLCLAACPVDAIIGLNKRMHVVLPEHCTGCELCLPACPVDCIRMENASGSLTGWAAWSQTQAEHARQRHRARQQRLATSPAAPEQAPPPVPDRQATVAAARARARARRSNA